MDGISALPMEERFERVMLMAERGIYIYIVHTDYEKMYCIHTERIEERIFISIFSLFLIQAFLHSTHTHSHTHIHSI